MGVTREYLLIGRIASVIASVEKYLPIRRKKERWKSGGEPPRKNFSISFASKRIDLASNAFYCVAMINFVTATLILRNF